MADKRSKTPIAPHVNPKAVIECLHVSRKGNTIAQLVARGDTGNVDEKICMNPFLLGIQTLANLDLS